MGSLTVFSDFFLGVSSGVSTYKYARTIHKCAFVLNKNHEEIGIHNENSIGIRGTSCMNTGFNSFLYQHQPKLVKRLWNMGHPMAYVSF